MYLYLRFGSHVSGDKPVIRNLKINNTSNVGKSLCYLIHSST